MLYRGADGINGRGLDMHKVLPQITVTEGFAFKHLPKGWSVSCWIA